MLAAYEFLIDQGGTTPGDIMLEDAGSTSIEESRKYALSKRIERTSNVRPLVLKAVGAICQGCGLDPKYSMVIRALLITRTSMFTMQDPFPV